MAVLEQNRVMVRLGSGGYLITIFAVCHDKILGGQKLAQALSEY
jgi:hypothetical protein